MKKLIAYMMIAIFMAGCAAAPRTEYLRDGKEYGVTKGLFRQRWWNYYERGISFAGGGFYAEAQKDFETAIGLRKADRWRARTYGLHFVNYFPHRELGIVHYRQGNYEDAVNELEASLATADNAKAKYFLNKARAEVIKKTGVDVGPPSITISAPADSSLSTEFDAIVTGTASDDSFISSVEVDGMPVHLELSAKSFEFRSEVALNEGENVITVIARDLAGNSAERSVKVRVDRRGPIITIEEQTALGPEVTVKGYVSDETGVSYLKINGENILTAPGRESAFERTVRMSRGNVAVVLESGDTAGNITVAEIPVSGEASITGNWAMVASAGEWIPIPETTGTFSPGEYELLAISLKGVIDTSPPTIDLKGLSAEQKVYDENILIEGGATDESQIKSLKINGREVIKKTGKMVYFSHLAGLETGKNEFTIEAVDSFGNEGVMRISVVREEQEIEQLGSRLSMALLPLERKGESSTAGDAAYDSLISALVNQGRFNVVERQKMEEILQELKLSATELVAPSNAAKMGKIVAADTMLTGTIVESEGSIEVIARLIDTETSSVISSNDVFDEQKNLMAVSKLMENLAYKFKRDLPLVEGIVIEAKGGEVLVDLGQDKNIRKNMKLILFREGEPIKHPVTGKVLGASTEEIAEAVIKDVYEEFSKASVTSKEKPLKTMDRVITR